jgi:predicted Ser/Thr protein kinase
MDGKYRVEAILGQGGMGTVYRALHVQLERSIALKVLRTDVEGDEESGRRFVREARAVASLKNPHTITLHDFGVTSDGLRYFTMEFLEGRPLSRLLKEEGPMAWRRALRLVLQACESLKEAHGLGILHRDLKPDNLFVTKDGEGNDFVKVLDFGLAKVLESSEHLTATGVAFGTPMYMSPEQARGDAMDARSDLYSLGAVLYEMLTGEPPFASENAFGYLVRHVTEQPKRLRERRPDLDLPPGVEDVVSCLLAKSPDERPADVSALVTRLRAVLAMATTSAESIRSRAPTDVGPAVGGARGGLPRWAPWALVACIGAGLAASWFAWSQGWTEDGTRETAATTTAGSGDRAALEAAWLAAKDPLAPAACRVNDARIVAALTGPATTLATSVSGSPRPADREALAALEAIAPEAGGSAEYWVLLSRARRIGGQAAPAVVSAAERALGLCPDFPAGLKALGAASLLGGDPGAARDRLARAVEMEPDYLAARFNLGLADIVGRRWDDAAATLKVVADRDPNDAQAWLYLGKALLGKGDPAGANAAFCKAKALGSAEAAAACGL